MSDINRKYLFFYILYFFLSICLNAEAGEKKIPVPFSSDSIWFYDRNMQKVIPEIDTNWITIAFHSSLTAPKTSKPQTDEEILFLNTAGEIINRHEELIDLFYDMTLWKNACFFRVQEGTAGKRIQEIIVTLNTHEYIRYAHPAIRTQGKTFAFSNRFEMKWKTGVEPQIRSRIMAQAHVSSDTKNDRYEVDLFQISFFEAIRLLAEDIHAAWAVPCLAELKPSCIAMLSLGINGGNLGDNIPFLLTITFSERVRLDASSIANIRLQPVEIQKELFDIEFDPYDHVKAVEKSPVQLTGQMRFYTPGTFTIPSVTVQYTCTSCSGKPIKSTQTTPQPVKIASIVPRVRNNRLLMPENNPEPFCPIEFHHKKANAYLIFSLVSFLAATLALGWTAGNFYINRKKNAELKHGVQKENLAIQLTESVNKLDDPHWKSMAEIGKLLRMFLIETYRITQYAPGGTGDIFFNSVRHGIPPSVAPIIRGALNRIDHAAAQELDTYQESDAFISEILQIIRHLDSNNRE